MRKLDIRPRFKTDVLRAKRSRLPIDWETLDFVLEELAAGRDVPPLLKPHALRNEWAGYSEFHLEEDLLVIYRLTDAWAEIHRLGTHRELFS
ncbi:MAG: type II toxin-antitoxin system YafQ family toxin [Pseudomonadota bacterium]